MQLSELKYKNSQIYYNNEKLFIETPILKCKSSIQHNYNKYELLLEINNEKFLNLLKNIELKNKEHCDPKSIYKSNIYKYNNNTHILKVKIPFRYKKFEVDIFSHRIYLPTSEDIKDDVEVKCNIHISKIWHYRKNNDEYMSGCIMELKRIEII